MWMRVSHLEPFTELAIWRYPFGASDLSMPEDHLITRASPEARCQGQVSPHAAITRRFPTVTICTQSILGHYILEP